MPITSPADRNWWDVPIGVHEKIWITLVVLVGLGLFIMMPVWHVLGAQNSSTESYRVSPAGYAQKVTDWSKGLPVTERGVKPSGQDVYLIGQRWSWTPNAVELAVDVPYRIHLSSRDVMHGFSLHQEGVASQKVNFQVVPGYEYVLKMEFSEPGTYNIICQEYCGAGHQFMLGKLVVVEGGK